MLANLAQEAVELFPGDVIRRREQLTLHAGVGENHGRVVREIGLRREGRCLARRKERLELLYQ